MLNIVTAERLHSSLIRNPFKDLSHEGLGVESCRNNRIYVDLVHLCAISYVVAGCDDPNQIYLDGCCVNLSHVYQWGAECNYIICSPDSHQTCTNSCCDGELWITEDGCAPCVFI